MALVAAQRKAIKGGLAMDTSIDRLSSNTPYHQTSQGSREAPRTKVATAYPVQLTRTQEPVRFNGHWRSQEPLRPQNQWGMQRPARVQSQWGPGRPHVIRTMPAVPLTCYSCSQPGHMKQDCPQGGSYGTRGGAAPATIGRGRGGYPPSAAYQPPRKNDRSRLTCFKCLNKGHTVQECHIPDNKLEPGGGTWTN